MSRKVETWKDLIGRISEKGSVKILRVYECQFAMSLFEGPFCISKELVGQYQFVLQNGKYMGIVPKEVQRELKNVVEVTNSEFIFREGELTIAYLK